MVKYPIMLTGKRAALLIDVLDAWLEEMEPATQDIEGDRTLTDVESLLSAIDGMHDQFAELTELRIQLGAIHNVGAC